MYTISNTIFTSKFWTSLQLQNVTKVVTPLWWPSKELLELSNINKYITIHKKLQYIYIYIYICIYWNYKFRKDISPTIMNELFQFLENPFYEVRIDLHPSTRCTVNFVSESIINLSTILLNTVLENINSSESLNAFRFNVKHWTLNHQPYPFCKTYIGFYCITYTF